LEIIEVRDTGQDTVVVGGAQQRAADGGPEDLAFGADIAILEQRPAEDKPHIVQVRLQVVHDHGGIVASVGFRDADPRLIVIGPAGK